MILRYNLFTFLWAAVILTTTLLPSTSMPDTSVWPLISFDSLAHAIMFMVLLFLMTVGLKKQFTYVKLKHYAIRASLFICSMFGIGIELLQHHFIYGREGNIYDVISNTIGCLLGIVLFKWIYEM